MKNLIIATIALFAINCAYSQTTRTGNTFKTEKTVTKADTLTTKYTFEDSKGTTYPIVVNKKTGSCYIWKKSAKTGKMYKQYMKADICQTICSELGIPYTPKNKK